MGIFSSAKFSSPNNIAVLNKFRRRFFCAGVYASIRDFYMTYNKVNQTSYLDEEEFPVYSIAEIQANLRR